MTRTLSESAVVREFADQLCRRLARRLIARLQKLTEGMQSGDDSCLTNIWEEICVQVQYEESVFWDAYDETVRGLAACDVKPLRPHERDAIWLQTPAADEWSCQDESSRAAYPITTDDIVDYLVTEYIYKEAGDWSNPRIRRHLERATGRD